MTILSSTDPHFIRAMKPNLLKQKDVFDSFNVLRQLNYAGLLQTINVRQHGYSFRPTFEEFYLKFRVLIDEKAVANKDFRAKCDYLLSKVEIDRKLIQMGVSKLFLKDAQVFLLFS